MRAAPCIAALALLVAPPAQAGCCFLWMDDGSRSGCKEEVQTRQACEEIRRQAEWDRSYFVDEAAGERCACEDADGRRGGELPVKYYTDRDDLDADGNRQETVRRRFVVSVAVVEVVNGRCREQHRLYSGWTDSEYS